MQALFTNPVGGYRKLDSFTLATIIQLETWRFCQTFFDAQNDPKGRWFDQMTQAARSGRANIVEGSEDSVTSRETELKLLGVARGSLAELLGDYEMWLGYSGALPWSRSDASEAMTIRLDPMPEKNDEDIVRASALHTRSQRAKFAKWLDSPDSVTRANCLIVLIRRTMLMIQKQLQRLGADFTKNGGLREQLTAARLHVRNGEPQTAESWEPLCPKCGRPMRRRFSQKTGESFWGCTGYADGCRGTRPM